MENQTRKETILLKRMRKAAIALCCMMLTIVAFSCQHSEIYYEFEELKNASWSKNDTLKFNIDSTLFEFGVPYDITLEVTNNVNYPYQNIWFVIQDNLQSDTAFASISNEYVLADEFGRWNGSGFGSLYQIPLLLEKSFVFKERRNYTIKIIQGMRDEPLVGIEKVGIRINRLEL